MPGKSILKVVNKFMDCGDLDRRFARIRCDHCQKDQLLVFSCKGRWFCPSCHQKKVQLFGALFTETILLPVPHRHVTLTILKMLRPYFRYHRNLLKDLRRIEHECVRDVMRISLDQPEGVEVIDVSEHQPRRIPSKKWQDLIKSKIPVAKQTGESLGGRSHDLARLPTRDADCLHL